MSEIKTNETSKQRWVRETVQPTLRKAPERRDTFTTGSGQTIERLYAAEDLAALDYGRDIHNPGEFPYVRGIDRAGYTAAPWVMRQGAGFGTPDGTNQRYQELLAAGATGLDVVFDRPTLMGLDPDDAHARGDVGKSGVSVASLADMERLFDGIALGEVTTTLTANGPAAILFAMYLVAAEKRGADWTTVAGAMQHDVLDDLIAGTPSLFPLQPSMRLVTDTVAFCSTAAPRWTALTVSGYRMREAGATAVQELAFALGNGLEYVRRAVDAGLSVDDIAPRMSCVFDAQSDFFEEIAKYRAARKLWAEAMRDRFGAADPRSCQLRFHTRTAQASVTAQQPYNNVVRTALQAMAAVLGGTTSLHTNAFDEALGTTTPNAATIALRTQQIIAHESGVTKAADPLGGAYFVEALTHQLETGVRDYWTTIDVMGGMAAAIAQSYPQREIASAAERRSEAAARRDHVIVGVNDFVQDSAPPDAPSADDGAEAAQLECLAALRAARNDGAVQRALESLRQTARGTGNTMPALLECVRADATLGEMCGALREVWGS